MEKYTQIDVLKLLKQKIKPLIKNPYDALFILLHSIMESAGFKLVALGEGDNTLIQNKELPENWNTSPDAWAFRYRHFKSSMTFHLKALRLGSQLLVHALAVEQNEVYNINLQPNDYVIETSNYDDIELCFKNIDKLITLFDKEILRKLMPTTEDFSNSGTERSTNSTGNNLRESPVYPPQSPIYQDPLRVPRPVGQPTFPMGGGDLYPGPGGGFGYIPGLDPFARGGGSFVGPNHPSFGIRDPYAPNPAYFPGRGGMPPRGARFDPFGPPGVRPYPDHDHMPPPGNFDHDDMYM